jgi:hypothetical protein
MRRYAASFLAVFIIVLSACPNPSGGGGGNGEETKPPQDGKTRVYFVNNNDFSVTVYSDYSRLSKFADVTANSQSDEIESAPNDSAVFYLTYRISIDDVPFPYEEESLVARIDAEKITTLTIPRLSELDPTELAKPITAGVHIKIQNTSSSSLILRRGNREEIPQGANSPILNAGDTGHYLITAGSVSGYSFMKNSTTSVTFPAGLTNFVSGHFYSLDFDGSVLTLLADNPITIEQALASVYGTVPLPPAKPAGLVASADSGGISLRWNKAANANSYDIYRATSTYDTLQKIKEAVKETACTDTGVTGGYTYYYSVKAVNSSGESSFSDRVSARAVSH